MSTGDSTRTTREPTSTSKKSLMLSVLIRAVRDVVQGSQGERMDVLKWLANREDFTTIVEPLGLDPEVTRLRIASLFKYSPALRAHYASRMIQDLMVLDPEKTAGQPED